MSSAVAAVVFGIGVLGLFFFDRSEKPLASKFIWIPTLWLFFCSSRSLAQWIGGDYPEDTATAYLEGNPIDRNCYLALEALALIVIIIRGKRAGPILRRNWAMMLFFVYALFSIAWSDYPFVTLKHWIKGIGDILMILIVLTEANVAGAVRLLFTRLAFLLVPLSLLLIWYYPALGRSHTMDWTPEAVGVATQKNGLGELCDIYGLALLWRFRSAYNDRNDPKRWQRLLAMGAVLAMAAWLLHLCNSMTSICALSMAGFVMLLSARPAFRRKPALVHILIVGVIVCTLYALFFQSSGALIQGLGRNPSLTGRTVVWEGLVKVVNNPIVGVGYESFWLGSRLQQVWVITQGLEINEAHCGYLEVLLTLGWIGVVLLGMLITIGYRNVIRAYRSDPANGSLRIAWFIAPLITGLTESAFRMVGLTWIVFLLATATSRWGPALNICNRRSPGGLPIEPVQDLAVPSREQTHLAGQSGISRAHRLNGPLRRW